MPRLNSAASATARAYGMGSNSEVPTGQIEWTLAGLRDWVVPDGVFSICGVCVGGGGDDTGDGGGLHWRNDISVTPGETLHVQTGTSDRFSGAPIESYVKRGSTYLLRADHTTYSGTLGGGGGNGGSGSGPGAPVGSRGAGGAGGYMGRGGNGGNDGLNPPPAGSGGGNSGTTGDGQGVGLQGRTADFAPGSRGTPKVGGGLGEGQSSDPGGVRFMWGNNRSYPDAAVDV
jgi:hypothetical protein